MIRACSGYARATRARPRQRPVDHRPRPRVRAGGAGARDPPTDPRARVAAAARRVARTGRRQRHPSRPAGRVPADAGRVRRRRHFVRRRSGSRSEATASGAAVDPASGDHRRPRHRRVRHPGRSLRAGLGLEAQHPLRDSDHRHRPDGGHPAGSTAEDQAVRRDDPGSRGRPHRRDRGHHRRCRPAGRAPPRGRNRPRGGLRGHAAPRGGDDPRRGRRSAHRPAPARSQSDPPWDGKRVRARLRARAVPGVELDHARERHRSRHRGGYRRPQRGDPRGAGAARVQGAAHGHAHRHAVRAAGGRRAAVGSHRARHRCDLGRGRGHLRREARQCVPRHRRHETRLAQAGLRFLDRAPRDRGRRGGLAVPGWPRRGGDRRRSRAASAGVLGHHGDRAVVGFHRGLRRRLPQPQSQTQCGLGPVGSQRRGPGAGQATGDQRRGRVHRGKRAGGAGRREGRDPRHLRQRSTSGVPSPRRHRHPVGGHWSDLERRHELPVHRGGRQRDPRHSPLRRPGDLGHRGDGQDGRTNRGRGRVRGSPRH